MKHRFSKASLVEITVSYHKVQYENRTPLEVKRDEIAAKLAERNTYAIKMAELDSKIAALKAELREEPTHTKYVKVSGSKRKHITPKAKRPYVIWQDGSEQFIKLSEVAFYEQIKPIHWK